jgi:hypothetical protein
MRLTVELTSEEAIVLIRNETRFDYCTWEQSDQLEEIIEYTFEDADVEGVQEASESRLLAQCKRLRTRSWFSRCSTSFNVLCNRRSSTTTGWAGAFGLRPLYSPWPRFSN